MMRHIYNLFRGTIPSSKTHHPVVCLDEAIECPACGDVWDDASEIAEKLQLCGEDAEKRTYQCRKCGATLEVTCMIALWRYKTEVQPPVEKGRTHDLLPEKDKPGTTIDEAIARMESAPRSQSVADALAEAADAFGGDDDDDPPADEGR